MTTNEEINSAYTLLSDMYGFDVKAALDNISESQEIEAMLDSTNTTPTTQPEYDEEQCW